MSKRLVWLGALIVALAALPACGGGAGSAPGEVTADASLAFEPKEITVQAGDTVTWTVVGSQPHTVTAYEDDMPDGAEFFTSGGAASEQKARDEVSAALLEEGDTFEHTFDAPGTYRYFCIPHENAGMTGRVVVEG